MAKGKTHDGFNLVIGALLSGVILGISKSFKHTLVFSGGWLFATLVFGPDSDLMPKKRIGVILRFVLYPYAIFFKHRGLSHNFLFGTLTRVIYGVLALGIMIHFLKRAHYIEFSGEAYLTNLKQYILSYDYYQLSYQLITWGFLGMFLADLSHICLDKFSSGIKKFL